MPIGQSTMDECQGFSINLQMRWLFLESLDEVTSPLIWLQKTQQVQQTLCLFSKNVHQELFFVNQELF
jgi:hypothetical protein